MDVGVYNNNNDIEDGEGREEDPPSDIEEGDGPGSPPPQDDNDEVQYGL